MNRHERRKTRALGKDPRLEGMDLRYDGRTLIITTFVNTDEDPNEVGMRVREAARGERKDMVLVTVAEAKRDAAAKMWSQAFETAEHYVKVEGKA